jgi:hypothetical protein
MKSILVNLLSLIVFAALILRAEGIYDEKVEVKASDFIVLFSGPIIHDKIANYVVEIGEWNRQMIEKYTSFVEERLSDTDPMQYDWDHLPESYRQLIEISSYLTFTFELMQLFTAYLKETTQTYIVGNLGQAEYVLLIIVVHWNKAYTTLIPRVLSHLEVASTASYKFSDLFDRAGVTQQEKDVLCTISKGLTYQAELFEELLNRTNALSMDLNVKFNEVFQKLQHEGWIDIREVQAAPNNNNSF